MDPLSNNKNCRGQVGQLVGDVPRAEASSSAEPRFDFSPWLSACFPLALASYFASLQLFCPIESKRNSVLSCTLETRRDK